MTARVAFSPELPVIVTASGFVYRGKVYGKGEPFPWRELGLDEHEIGQLWYTLKVDCLPAVPTEPPPRKPRRQR